MALLQGLSEGAMGAQQAITLFWWWQSLGGKIRAHMARQLDLSHFLAHKDYLQRKSHCLKPGAAVSRAPGTPVWLQLGHAHLCPERVANNLEKCMTLPHM